MLSRHRSYRCGYCSINWPLEDRFQRCPRCTTFLSPHKAKAMSQHETAAQLEEMATKARRNVTFYEIISGGGFTNVERNVIARLETELLRREYRQQQPT